jgi:hypothetical protein
MAQEIPLAMWQSSENDAESWPATPHLGTTQK